MTSGGLSLYSLASYQSAASGAVQRFDGYIARKRGLVSVWGQFLDPVADKLIVMATLVTAPPMESSGPSKMRTPAASRNVSKKL